MINNINCEIGSKITSIREQAGISKQKLAELSGISLNTLDTYESGKEIPSFGEITNICNFLKIHPLTIISENKLSENTTQKNNSEVARETMFSKVIRHERLKSRLTEQTASEELGIQENFLSDMETGKILPDEKLLQKIAILYSTDSNFLTELLYAQKNSPLICNKLSQAESLFGNIIGVFNNSEKIDDQTIKKLRENLSSYLDNSEFSPIAERDARYFSIGHLSDRLLKALQKPEFCEKVELMAKEFMENPESRENTDSK